MAKSQMVVAILTAALLACTDGSKQSTGPSVPSADPGHVAPFVGPDGLERGEEKKCVRKCPCPRIRVPDQQQLVYNGGTSARTLPGYSVWQSFTPSISGTLTEIDMGFFNDMAGGGQLQILSGDGTAGPVLQTLTVPVVGITQPGVTWNAWTVRVHVAAGSFYTFKFTPNAATLPDPYGVAIGAGDPYPRGVMGLDDPSGSYRTDLDVVFRTFVRRRGHVHDCTS
jgi:hypothetical protein